MGGRGGITPAPRILEQSYMAAQGATPLQTLEINSPVSLCCLAAAKFKLLAEGFTQCWLRNVSVAEPEARCTARGPAMPPCHQPCPAPGSTLQHVRDNIPPPKPFNSHSTIANSLLPKHFPPSLQKNKKRNQKVHKIFFIWRQRALGERPPASRRGGQATQGATAGLPGSARRSPALTMHQIAMKGFIAQSSSPYQSTIWLKERRPFKASLQQSLYFYFKSIWKLKIPFGSHPLWRESQACRLAKQPCSSRVGWIQRWDVFLTRADTGCWLASSSSTNFPRRASVWSSHHTCDTVCTLLGAVWGVPCRAMPRALPQPGDVRQMVLWPGQRATGRSVHVGFTPGEWHQCKT